MITYELKRENEREKAKLILNSIDQLAVVPEFLQDVLRSLNRENVSINETAKLINKDQSLVTKILRIANSPLYGLYRRVSTVDYALHIIGLAEVTNIVTGITLMETFKIKSDKYLNQKDFWEHSFLVGNLSKSLSKDYNVPEYREAFVAGFLHDLGISVMHKYMHDSFIKIYEEAEKGKEIFEVEKEIVGMSHQEISLTLLDKWNFPVNLCQAVLFHHSPSRMQKEKSQLAAAIHLADYIVSQTVESSYIWDRNSKLDLNGLSVLGIMSVEDVEAIKENYKDQLNVAE